MPRLKIVLEPGTTVDLGQPVYQDRRNAIDVSSAKDIAVYVLVTENLSSADVTFNVRTHFDRDAKPSE